MLARSTFLWISIGTFAPSATLLLLGTMIPRGYKKNRPKSAVTGDVNAEANGYPPFLVQFMAVRRSHVRLAHPFWPRTDATT
eukprot:2184649-Prymnesium_polylepis.3